MPHREPELEERDRRSIVSADRWRRPSPTTVLFREGEGNLSKACAALAHQVTTLDKSKLLEPALGALSSARLTEVEGALRNYLEL